MPTSYEILVPGNSCEWSGGFFGFANLTLVTSPDGTLLFDTGHYINRGALIKALAERDMEPGDVDKVFISHTHFDHADNVDLFVNATVFMGKADWDYADHPAQDDYFVPWLIHEQLKKHKLELLDGDTDIGGGITALALPGHTPGSMGVSFEHDKGTIVLAGDAIKNVNEVLTGEQANVEHRFPVSDSLAHDKASIAKVVAMADRIVPGHFSELYRVDEHRFGMETAQSLALEFK